MPDWLTPFNLLGLAIALILDGVIIAPFVVALGIIVIGAASLISAARRR